MRLIYIGFGWGIGIFLAANISPLPPIVWMGLAVWLLVSVVLTWQTPDYRLFNIILLALTLGGLRYSLVPTASDISHFNNTGGLTIEGVVVADPDIRDDRSQLRVRVDTVIRGGRVTASSGDVLVRAPRLVEARYGDRVTVTGLLYTPARYDTFSYADYLFRENIFSLMDQARVEVLSGGHGSSVWRDLYELRRRTGDAIAEMLPEPKAGLLTGILLGNERGISPELDEDFRVVGASHIIAISGFNMTIVAGIVIRVLQGLFPKRTRINSGLAISAIGVYTIFVGANPAVLRAFWMSMLLIIGTAAKRKTYIPTSLVFSAAVMSLFDPNVLWSISFQLSFFAVLGLALFTDPIQRYFDALLAWLMPKAAATGTRNILSEPIVVTLAVQITVLPIIIAHFGRVSLVVVVVNILIVPVQSYLLIIGGGAMLLVFALPSVAQALFWLDYFLLAWTIGVVRLFATLPFADVAFQVNSGWITIYFTLLTGGALMHATQPVWWQHLLQSISKRAVLVAVSLAGLGLVALMVLIALSRPDDRLHVWFLDVGHNNAVLVQTPGGAQVLVDGGYYPSRLLTAIGDRLPFTDREIEVLVISQPDEFDTGALSSVLKRYDVGVALTNGQPNLGPVHTELSSALAEYPVVPVTAGYTVTLDDGVLIEVLHPQRTPSLGDSINAGPVVLRISFGEVSFLLPSDLSREGQEALLKAGQWPVATVLQLPQHGGERSLERDFLEAVQPQVIVIQSDSANRRGDPDPDTLTMLPEDVPIWRTDDGGVIHIYTDGDDLWVEQ
jgi:competence protein ComEC